MRRTSWASVVSGNAGASAPPPQRSGFLSSALSQAGHATRALSDSQPAQSHETGASSNSPRPKNAFSSDPSERPNLPPLNSTLADLRNDVMAALMGQQNLDFFIPTYLRRSRYAEKLEERQRAKNLAQREGRAKRSSLSGSLSASTSSANLHKTVPAYRGMTHEIIDHPSQQPDASDVPELPWRWNHADKLAGIDVSSDGLEVKFNGNTKTTDEGAAIRADRSIPRHCGIYYFEMTILSKTKDNSIAVGFSTLKVPLNRMPGWEPESWAYHADDGNIFNQTAQPKAYGPKSGQGDVIGCGVDFHNNLAFFTRNGYQLGTAFRDIKVDQLLPAVGFKGKGETIRVNFGQMPFVYDIDGLVNRTQVNLHNEVLKTDVSQLHDGQQERSFLEDLVAQYLAHDGYVETAKAFSAEVHRNSSLVQGLSGSTSMVDYQEDQDAANRQQIRAAILEGDVDRALKLTRTFYPSVLENNENIYFKLRCRKFIEMIRGCTDIQNSAKTATGHGHKRRPDSIKDVPLNGHAHSELLEGRMELDTMDENPNGSEFAVDDAAHDMDLENATDEADSFADHAALLSGALAYGQELQAEFKDDPRREVKQTLEETFALIAYPDARESSLAPLLEADGRVPVAEELNSAILVSLGKSSCAVLERLYQQTEVVIDKMAVTGDAAGFINVKQDYLRPSRLNQGPEYWD